MNAHDKELEETLKLMHMLAKVFAPEKYAHEDSPNATIVTPTPIQEEVKVPRFTALKAKLEAHSKMQEVETSETPNAVSEG